MIAFINALLIDGTGSAPMPGATVIVSGKTIAYAGMPVAVPDGAFTIDLRGKPLLPGFSDAHTHLGGSSMPERPGLTGHFVSYDYAANREQALLWGVTAVRSAGDFVPDIFDFRDKVNAGEIQSPRVIASGPMFQAKGGHPACTVYSGDEKIADKACVIIDADTDIEAAVSSAIASGADWIKAFVSDHKPRLSSEQLKRIADAAHQNGKPVMMHVDDVNGLNEAIDAGADTIEHTIGIGTSAHELTDEILKKLTSRKIWVVPTMVVTKTFGGGADEDSADMKDLTNAVNQMIEAGVRLGVGCDSGIPFIPYGECVHTEMRLLSEAGYSPLQAITAATGGNAELLGAADLFGTISRGKAADIVVLGEDPTKDIRRTRDIRLVVRDGEIVLDRLLGEEMV